MMNEKKCEKVTGLVITMVTDEDEITTQIIKDRVKFFEAFYPLSSEEESFVVKSIESRLHVKINRGVYVKEKTHKPWYHAAKADIDSKYWGRYDKYLKNKQGWAPKVVTEMDEATDDIMELLGNPMQEEGFQIRGLCIGDVQSGKTSNYIGLINKAADAGYRVIILLTGVIEKLRSQTQERIDAGFTGRDSEAFLKNKINKIDKSAGIGVFDYDNSISGLSVTTKTRDFRVNAAQALGVSMDSLSVPIIFVLKKNKGVLWNLETWLKTFNADKNGKVNYPLLLIDDEADNASVNTKGKDSATAINAGIRRILNLFTKASYVGFTATPYANIFINPDSDDEMLQDDLFPKDFIYALSAPSNYIGAQSVFLEKDDDDENSDYGKYHELLRNNNDCEGYLPLKHKKDFEPDELPESLKRAIIQFFLANVIRDLRGDKNKHRTMMINISRFIAVQNRVEKQVSTYVKEMQRAIQNYYLTGNRALENREFQQIKRVYEEDFYGFKLNSGKESQINYSWEKIQKQLKPSVAPIKVKAVNGGNASNILDYEQYSGEENGGLRLIAVGGLSLSRGLTLEGLCISYFYRNSKMYDTLLQMGRWFGYRPGYDDLCRIWMSDESVAWYKEITEATEELRRRIRRMQNDGATPKDFGLCVRQDQTALLVTARNKMKTAADYTSTVTLSGSVIDTKYFSSEKAVAIKNLNLTINFLKKLLKNYRLERNNSNLAIKNPQFLDVNAEDIMDYLCQYHSHWRNTTFQPDDIIQAFESEGKQFTKWDVAVAQGSRNAEPLHVIAGLEALDPMIPVSRGFSYQKENKLIQASGKSSHLADKGMSKAGLKKEESIIIEKDDCKITGKAPSAETYFQAGIVRNPLLVIYPVRLKSAKSGENPDAQKEEVCNNLPLPVIGLSIGVPSIDGKRPIKHNYKINITMQKQLMQEKGDLDEANGDYEETDETIPEDNEK